MKLAEVTAIAKLALAALDRGNLDLARGFLVDIAGSAAAEPTVEPSGIEVAVTITDAAKALSYSTKHVRSLIDKGALGDAVIGSGRGTRILVSSAIEALRDRSRSVPKAADAVEEAGAKWAARSRLRVVR